MKKAGLVASFMVVTVLAVYAPVISAASVEDSTNYLPIVTKLSAAFNLSAADALKVFDADSQEKESACQAVS